MALLSGSLLFYVRVVHLSASKISFYAILTTIDNIREELLNVPEYEPSIWKKNIRS
jgi:hypothetical protein